MERKLFKNAKNARAPFGCLYRLRASKPPYNPYSIHPFEIQLSLVVLALNFHFTMNLLRIDLEKEVYLIFSICLQLTF